MHIFGAGTGRPVQYVKPAEGIMQRKVWMGELKYIVTDGCMLLNKSSTISVNCKERKRQWCQNSDLNCRKTEKEFTNETSDRCLQELNLLCCWQLSTLYTCNNFSTVSGTCGWSNHLHLARAVRAVFFWTRDAFHKFSQSYGIGGADSRSPCWFRLNILKLIQKWQGSSSSLQARFTGLFLSDLCLCAKECVSYADGADRACLCRASEGQCDETCVCPCACLRVFCFCFCVG